MTPGAARVAAVVSHGRGSVLSVLVVPRAGCSSLKQLADGSIQVRVAAPPVDGAANTALLRFLATRLDVPRSRLEIISGGTSRRNRIAVAGLTAVELTTRLQAALGNDR